MIVILNDYTCPFFNLASEEYMQKNFKDNIFMLWRSYPSILLGKNQNVYKEINVDYVEKNNIDVVRRNSGGGTVFCDMGNTNFSFIVNTNDSKSIDYKDFTKPILEVLIKLGANAQFKGRNDITIDNKKISGNAQYLYKKRCLHHGTLLFSSNITSLSSALRTDRLKYKDKNIDSVASRVTNISDHINDKIDIVEFRKIIINYILDTNKDAVYYEFNDKDIEEINKIVEDKYKTWEWNYGYNSKYNFNNEQKITAGVVEVTMDVTDGLIQNIKFYGDFLSRKDISTIEDALKGSKHDYKTLYNILNNYNLDDYFMNSSIEELLNLLF